MNIETGREFSFLNPQDDPHLFTKPPPGFHLDIEGKVHADPVFRVDRYCIWCGLRLTDTWADKTCHNCQNEYQLNQKNANPPVFGAAKHQYKVAIAKDPSSFLSFLFEKHIVPTEFAGTEFVITCFSAQLAEVFEYPDVLSVARHK